MRIEVGLDLLHFALAEADCLDVLERYRGRCEPTFLFYAIKDEALSDEDEHSSHEKDDGEDEDVVSAEKTCTLAIIKPDAVVHGKADEIIMKIQEAGFDILTDEERTLTEAEMRLFYDRTAGEEAFEKLVHHMCSGPSHLLILTRTEGVEDVVTAWRTLMGPCDPEVARREQPDSLRAQYGTEMPFNAVHGSQDREDASRELALLFPGFKFSDEVLEAPRGDNEQRGQFQMRLSPDHIPGMSQPPAGMNLQRPRPRGRRSEWWAPRGSGALSMWMDKAVTEVGPEMKCQCTEGNLQNQNLFFEH
ncbi:thioredoxin domain-containing protein 6 isoform X10 [Equus caballus]